MTIITLQNIVTGSKTRIQSINDLQISIDSNWNSKVTQRIKWIYEETGEDVSKEFLDLLYEPKLYQKVSKDTLIYKIE